MILSGKKDRDAEIRGPFHLHGSRYGFRYAHAVGNIYERTAKPLRLLLFTNVSPSLAISSLFPLYFPFIFSLGPATSGISELFWVHEPVRRRVVLLRDVAPSQTMFLSGARQSGPSLRYEAGSLFLRTYHYDFLSLSLPLSRSL